MAAWLKYKVKQPISDRQPDEKSQLPWLQRETHPFLQQVRRVLNWVVDYLGKAGVDATDTPGLLGAKIVVDPATMTATVEGDEGARTLKLSAISPGAIPGPPGPPGPSGPAAPVPPPISDASGGYLYTARTHDPLDKGQVVCCFLGPHFAGGNSPMLTGFTQPEPGVFISSAVGAIPPEWLDGVDVAADRPDGAASPMLGKRILAYHPGASLYGTEEPLQQVLIIEDVGGHMEAVPGHPGTYTFVSTPARFRRAPGFTQSSDYVHNMTFGIQTGNKYGASFLTLSNSSVTLGSTALSWALTTSPTYPWNYGHELLSASQFTTDKFDATTIDMSVTTASGSPGVPAVNYLSNAFLTLSGTPGITKLTAGSQLFQVERLSLVTADLAGTTQVLARLMITDSTGGTVITELTPEPAATFTPNTTVDNYQLPYTLAADIDMTTVQRFALLFGISTTCTSPATLTFRINSATHGTWWKGTFKLTTLGNPNPPWSDIGPTGSDVRPLKTVAIDGSGGAPLVFGPAGANFYVITGAGPLKFLPTPSIYSGQTTEVTAVIESASVQLQHAASSPPTGYSTLYLPAGSTSFKNAKATHKFLWRADLSAWLREGT